MKDNLKLTNQICFPFYAISRKITQAYTPYLNEIDLTYPQYLVMLVLWEKDSILIKEICSRLILETNTISPILKTLIGKGLISKQKREGNNKETFVVLTSKGKILEEKASNIPEKLLGNFAYDEKYLKDLHKNLWEFLERVK